MKPAIGHRKGSFILGQRGTAVLTVQQQSGRINLPAAAIGRMKKE
jgi:hypothetical protein